MKGYQLTRRWWDWCFTNPGKHTPAHSALYNWFVEANNRVDWSPTFEMAPQYAMTAIGVRSYNTYKDTLSDLQAWGFVRIRQKGLNQYTPWLLALSNFDEPLNKPTDEATNSAVSNFDIPLNKARNKALDEARNNPRDAFTINPKPETLNLKPTNENGAVEKDCLVDVKQKNEKPPRSSGPPPPTVSPFGDELPGLSEAWDTWTDYRREKNKPAYKPIGLKGVVTELMKLSENDEQQAIAIINQSIAKNWDGFYPLKRHDTNSSQPRNNKFSRNASLAEFGNELDELIADRHRA